MTASAVERGVRNSRVPITMAKMATVQMMTPTTPAITAPSERARALRRAISISSATVSVCTPRTALMLLVIALGGTITRRTPRWIIQRATILPIHATTSYFTVNSIGTAYCPYRVQSRSEFVDAIVERGYYRHDEWDNTGKRLELPEHPELSLDHYSGFCFDRRGL